MGGAHDLGPPAFEGLTATGAGVVGFVGVGIGALVDAAVSPGLGLFFATIFVLVSAFVGLRLGWHYLWAALAVPPLLYVAGAGVGSQVNSLSDGNWVQRTSSDIATAVVGSPLPLLIGTGIAILAMFFRSRLE